MLLFFQRWSGDFRRLLPRDWVFERISTLDSCSSARSCGPSRFARSTRRKSGPSSTADGMTDERASRKSRARSRQWPSSATRRCNRQPTPNCRPLLAATLPLPPVTWLRRELTLPFRAVGHLDRQHLWWWHRRSRFHQRPTLTIARESLGAPRRAGRSTRSKFKTATRNAVVCEPTAS